jgi:capsular exopolysaccharide synthesis family protein
VVYTDPILAADIANEVAEQLILHSPANLTPEQQRQIEFANLQIDRLNEQLDGFYAELEDVDARLETTQTGEDLQQATEARNVLIGQINQATYTIAQFSVGNISLQQRSNSLEIVERARVPIVSITPGIRGPILLGILVGAGLAGGLALLIEYLDDTVRTSEEVVELFSLPILGVIVKFKSRQEKLPGPLISQDQVGSIISEGYHALRTNLLATRDSDYKGVYIVTSPSPEDGKSITTANLAIAMAWAGQRVLLIDADLRQPSIHRFFDLENNRGLTTLLMQSGTDKIDIGSDSKFAVILKDCLQDSKIANLSVITSGLPPKENPSILLGSGLMQQWIEVFRESPNIDVVLIDTPPSLAVSDSLTLSLITDSEVVLVLSADKTQRAASRKAVEQFARINRSIKGIVLNNANTRDESYYDYSYYYHTPEKT